MSTQRFTALLVLLAAPAAALADHVSGFSEFVVRVTARVGGIDRPVEHQSGADFPSEEITFADGVYSWQLTERLTLVDLIDGTTVLGIIDGLSVRFEDDPSAPAVELGLTVTALTDQNVQFRVQTAQTNPLGAIRPPAFALAELSVQDNATDGAALKAPGESAMFEAFYEQGLFGGDDARRASYCASGRRNHVVNPATSGRFGTH